MKTKTTTYYECIYNGTNMLCYKTYKKYYLLGNHIGRIEVKQIGKQLTKNQVLKQINN
jgi:hypothetical protein